MNYRIVLNPMYIWKRLKELQGNLPEEYHMPMIVLLFDMAISFIMTGCSVKDYMLYEFYKLNHFGKRQFFTAAKADRWFKKYNDPILLNELKDKEKALIKFNKFINRDWCGVTSKNTESDYEEFIKKHKKAILKPLDECGGHGIYIAEINDLQKFRGVYRYCMEHKLIIEELIKQNQVMAELHEESVNTIRIMTYKGRVIAAILRMGVGKSEIDNASSGGIYAAVDIKTGIVVSHALNYKGEKYIYHPTTQTIIPGFQIPMWNECLNYVKEGAKLIKGVPLVGWDIAVTDDGPTLVEVNESPDPFLAQSILGEGIAKEINLRKKGR